MPGSSLSGLRRRLVFSPLGANSLFTLISRRQIDKREALASVAGALLFPTRRQGYTDYRLGWSHFASVTTPDERLLRLADQYLSSYPDGSAGSYLTLVKDQLFSRKCPCVSNFCTVLSTALLIFSQRLTF